MRALLPVSLHVTDYPGIPPLAAALYYSGYSLSQYLKIMSHRHEKFYSSVYSPSERVQTLSSATVAGVVGRARIHLACGALRRASTQAEAAAALYRPGPAPHSQAC
jgi:hypothetical protein